MPFHERGSSGRPRKGKPAPTPSETSQEASYLKGLGEKQKPVRVKLTDGELVEGWIEYYDKHMVRLTRQDKPNLFIFKHDIVYISEDGGRKQG
jgi:host factor-I protein